MSDVNAPAHHGLEAEEHAGEQEVRLDAAVVEKISVAPSVAAAAASSSSTMPVEACEGDSSRRKSATQSRISPTPRRAGGRSSRRSSSDPKVGVGEEHRHLVAPQPRTVVRRRHELSIGEPRVPLAYRHSRPTRVGQSRRPRRPSATGPGSPRRRTSARRGGEPDAPVRAQRRRASSNGVQTLEAVCGDELAANATGSALERDACPAPARRCCASACHSRRQLPECRCAEAAHRVGPAFPSR